MKFIVPLALFLEFLLQMTLLGCAPHISTVHIPGCLPDATVVVPKGCYSTTFQGALEVRCDANTLRYVCPDPVPIR